MNIYADDLAMLVVKNAIHVGIPRVAAKSSAISATTTRNVWPRP
jgi:hypothetical protein